MGKKTEIIIDSRMFPWAMTYFVSGIEQLFGKKVIKFKAKPFNTINDIGRTTLNFIIKTETGVTKYAIDWFDSNEINNLATYKWCDVYGKVNFNSNKTPTNNYPKVVSIGPSMGIHWFSPVRAVILWLTNSFKAKLFLSNEVFHFLRYYLREQLRAPLSDYSYKPEKVHNGYLFFISTLWYNATWNDNDNLLNKPRSLFIKSARAVSQVHFEGGFVPHNNRNNRNGYTSSTEAFRDFLYNRGGGRKRGRISISDYIDKIQKSYVVFNMPAVVQCHGWKLAEYLALGKAIISFPLVNELPHPLEHGINIHFVNETEDSIKEALIYIYEHPEYRKKLEQGARKYWEDWCSPTKALELIGIKANEKS